MCYVRLPLHAPPHLECELRLTLVLDRAQLRVGEEVGQRTALVAPPIECILAQKDIVPLCAAAVFCGKAINPVAPSHRSFPLAEHVWTRQLALRSEEHTSEPSH